MAMNNKRLIEELMDDLVYSRRQHEPVRFVRVREDVWNDMNSNQKKVKRHLEAMKKLLEAPLSEGRGFLTNEWCRKVMEEVFAVDDLLNTPAMKGVE